ncbi:ABC transporter permease [Nocardia farcinica]|uniref:Dipeptide transport system permease protein dppB n=2 Tax=Nocardia farcinica TaxID=37329 RepID=A0A0H5NZF6_NOCFR|nr:MULTISPECIES: ABC transporter permease [Nocardia]AXK87017.1 ABC transporter permease [Nocardia farcinica]MBA4858441.1 ABC transporter permease [Nocardia farcinica]MBC9815661.1 ABC transporter permease [Nocardia farcinica]MBF6069920.1 ABC transporter permease [Nocardia farcinica]MBF6141623.1 ABC transporter permease [Nocardia farcinica]
MIGFLLRRAANYVVLLLLASFLTFAVAGLTFRPLDSLEQRNPRPPQAVIDAKAEQLHLDEPIPQRYLTWVSGAVRGDFGTTLAGQPVSEELGRRIGVSLRLLVIGSVLGTVLGVLIGAAGAIRQYRFSDYFTTIVSLVLLSTPIFLLATLLKYGALEINSLTGQRIFLYTGETSAHRIEGLWPQLLDRLQHLVLPTLALALGGMAGYSRYQRNAMLDVLQSDFIRTARAKGLTRGRALYKHGLRTALIPMATLFAYSLGGLITGATFTEKIFGWHGVGEWLVDAVNAQDIYVVVTVTVFTGLVVLVSGLLSDIVYAILDPRVRVG